MPFLDQGTTNGCGTTSLAMITSYLTGRPISQAQVDHEVRRMDIFSPPGELVEFARARGLSAEMYNNGSIDELKGFLDRGIPCQALISSDNSGSLTTLHYVAVVGYGVDDKGKEYVILHDPNKGDDPSTPGLEGGLVRMSMDEFKSKWSKPPAGFENFFIAYAPGGTSLPRAAMTASRGRCSPPRAWAT
jgi:ABC-type bacteriocin/lantibiotic exporter with double-glycine peptidase domain